MLFTSSSHFLDALDATPFTPSSIFQDALDATLFTSSSNFSDANDVYTKLTQILKWKKDIYLEMWNMKWKKRVVRSWIWKSQKTQQ